MFTRNHKQNFLEAGVKENFLVYIDMPDLGSNIGKIKNNKEIELAGVQNKLKQIEEIKKKAEAQRNENEEALLDQEEALNAQKSSLEDLITCLEKQKTAIGAKVGEIKKQIDAEVKKVNEDEQEALREKLEQALANILTEKDSQLLALTQAESASDSVIKEILESTKTMLNKFETDPEVQKVLQAVALFVENKAEVVKVLAQYESYGRGSGDWRKINEALCKAVMTAGEKTDFIEEDGSVKPEKLEEFRKQIEIIQGASGAAVDGQVGPETMTAIYRMLGIAEMSGEEAGFENVGFGETTVTRNLEDETQRAEYDRILDRAGVGERLVARAELDTPEGDDLAPAEGAPAPVEAIEDELPEETILLTPEQQALQQDLDAEAEVKIANIDSDITVLNDDLTKIDGETDRTLRESEITEYLRKIETIESGAYSTLENKLGELAGAGVGCSQEVKNNIEAAKQRVLEISNKIMELKSRVEIQGEEMHGERYDYLTESSVKFDYEEFKLLRGEAMQMMLDESKYDEEKMNQILESIKSREDRIRKIYVNIHRTYEEDQEKLKTVADAIKQKLNTVNENYIELTCLNEQMKIRQSNEERKNIDGELGVSKPKRVESSEGQERAYGNLLVNQMITENFDLDGWRNNNNTRSIKIFAEQLMDRCSEEGLPLPNLDNLRNFRLKGDDYVYYRPFSEWGGHRFEFGDDDKVDRDKRTIEQIVTWLKTQEINRDLPA